MSFFRRIFRVGQEEPKRKTYANIKRGENPELVWDTVGELGDGARDGIKKKAEGRGVMAKEHAVEFLPVGSTYLHLEDLEREGKTAIQG